MHCSIGITTGQCFCGVIGSDLRREYTVMGDLVNLSARLMANAGVDGILTDERTYSQARRVFAFEEHEPILVKGKEKPISIYSPTRRMAEVEEEENLGTEGRRLEIKKLRETIGLMSTYKSGGTVVLTGVSGCGRRAVLKKMITLIESAHLELAGEAEGYSAPSLPNALTYTRPRIRTRRTS